MSCSYRASCLHGRVDVAFMEMTKCIPRRRDHRGLASVRVAVGLSASHRRHPAVTTWIGQDGGESPYQDCLIEALGS